MELLNILAAATAAYVFGAIWYMGLSKPWMAATGIKESDLKDENGKNKSGPMPFIIAFLSALVVSFMMQHLFALVGVVQVIDAGYSSIGCAVIGLMLTLF